MNIVLFAHPDFLGSQSMPRFARYLLEGMRARGHQVAQWAPAPLAYRLSTHPALRKWLGYFDQYVWFPWQVRRRLRAAPPDTLFVFTDHALGPWVPLVAGRPHVVHCHDFLAQHSAQGRVPENPTGFTGRLYQRYIRRGYQRARHFISVSRTTAHDLLGYLPAPPATAAVVYNGLNPLYRPLDLAAARQQLGQYAGLALAAGYLLHVGGNQWYKNRLGCVELYNAWRALPGRPVLPLLLLGEAPGPPLAAALAASPYRANIHALSGVPDELVRVAYAGATLFLFPSLAEGFGWPIAEAQAAGCPVLTTGEAPMTEVGGEAAHYLPRRPAEPAAATAWAVAAAPVIQQLVGLPAAERQAVVAAGQANAARFESEVALDDIAAIYQTLVPAP